MRCHYRGWGRGRAARWKRALQLGGDQRRAELRRLRIVDSAAKTQHDPDATLN